MTIKNLSDIVQPNRIVLGSVLFSREALVWRQLRGNREKGQVRTGEGQALAELQDGSLVATS